MDDIEKRAHENCHDSNANPDQGGEGFNEEEHPGDLLGSSVHEGVRLEVQGAGEVDRLPPVVGDGKGGSSHHHLRDEVCQGFLC